MLTQCLTAAVLFSGGDVLAQQFVEKRGSLHDVRACLPIFPLKLTVYILQYTRTARLAFYGGAQQAQDSHISLTPSSD